jgi:hypothetical protein
MRKLTFLIVLLFVSVFLTADKVTVDMIDIPKDYAGLKTRYISCVLDLMKEIDEHGKTLKVLSNSQVQNSNLIILVKDLRVKLESAMKVGKDTFQHYFSISSGYNFDLKVQTYGVGWDGIFFEKFLAGVRAYMPSAISFELGYRF